MQNALPPLPQPQGGLPAPGKAGGAVTPTLATGGQPAGAQSGQVSIAWAAWFKAVDTLLRFGNFLSVLQLAGANVLTTAGGQTLTGGFNETPFDFKTVSTGTITPNPSKGLKQKVTNGGAFAIAATAEIGEVELLVTNGASAGAITLSGFTKQFTGDAFDTTSGHRFAVFIYAFDAGVTAVLVKALQ